jgi:hypothetical protein
MSVYLENEYSELAGVVMEAENGLQGPLWDPGGVPARDQYSHIVNFPFKLRHTNGLPRNPTAALGSEASRFVGLMSRGLTAARGRKPWVATRCRSGDQAYEVIRPLENPSFKLRTTFYPAKIILTEQSCFTQGPFIIANNANDNHIGTGSR